eukprot:7750463-Pyramimonas_sp.AAC.1
MAGGRAVAGNGAQLPESRAAREAYSAHGVRYARLSRHCSRARQTYRHPQSSKLGCASSHKGQVSPKYCVVNIEPWCFPHEVEQRAPAYHYRTCTPASCIKAQQCFISYPAYNKPASIIHWLDNYPDITAEYIIVLDADMILRNAFTVDLVGARKGHPIAAHYGYLIGIAPENYMAIKSKVKNVHKAQQVRLCPVPSSSSCYTNVAPDSWNILPRRKRRYAASW